MNKAISDRKLDALLTMSVDAIVEKNAESFLEQDYEIVPMPNSLRRKILGMDRRARWKNEFGAIGVGFKRVAAVILIACAAAMSVEAVRTAIWNAIVTWYDDYVAISFRKDGVGDAPETIVTKKEPMMDGYEREVLLDSPTMYMVSYSSESCQVVYTQTVLDQNELRIDAKKTSGYDISIGENAGQIFYADDKNETFIVWNDGEYSFTLQCNRTEDVNEALIEIAETIK